MEDENSCARDQAEGDARLLRLADKLMGEGDYVGVGPVKAEEFDMLSWYATEGAVASSLERFLATCHGDCGTTACAVGHAVADDWFAIRGLETHWGSITAFFALNGEKSSSYERRDDLFLFGYAWYEESNDPVAVATRLREFVAARFPGVAS